MSNTLFTRNSKSDHDEIWDDTLLIKAYEESVRLQKEEVAKELAMKTNTKRRKSENSESETSSSSITAEDLKVGDFVRSTYEDGVDYEAEILSINENGNALIKYIGYGNEERVKLEDLVASWGLEAREEQKLLAEADNPSNLNEDQEGLHQFVLNKTSGMSGKLPIPPMPPMPPSIVDNTRDSEYMSAMLMSWYMSGYYTGLYHGRKETRQELTTVTQPKRLESCQNKDQQRKKQRKRTINNKL